MIPLTEMEQVVLNELKSSDKPLSIIELIDRLRNKQYTERQTKEALLSLRERELVINNDNWCFYIKGEVNEVRINTQASIKYEVERILTTEESINLFNLLYRLEDIVNISWIDICPVVLEMVKEKHIKVGADYNVELC